MAFLELPHSDFAAVLALADGAALVLGRLCLPIHLASSCQDFRQRFLLWASSFSSFHLSATGENRVEVVGRCCRCRCRCRCRLLMSSPGRSVLGNPSTAEPVCFASHLRKYKSASAMFTSQQDATRRGISKWTNSAGAQHALGSRSRRSPPALQRRQRVKSRRGTYFRLQLSARRPDPYCIVRIRR
jgi:hypothetical protein